MEIPALPVIAIVIPCYKEELALPHTLPAIFEILDTLKDEGKISNSSYVLCVNDGSPDRTWDVIKELRQRYPHLQGISLAHNRGHQYALLAGLMDVKDRCDAAVSIDADLQDDPRAIIKMIDMFRGGTEIVYGVRASRSTDTWFKRSSARSFYSLQHSFGLQTIYDHADYRLMSARALDILSQYKEQNLFLRGIVPQIGLTWGVVEYDRNPRVAGESKYPLSKMLAFSIDGITSFTAKPLRLVLYIGMILLLLDICVSIYVLVSYLLGYVVSGWTSIMLSVWFIGSLILIALGIMGEYIGKIFNEVKQRPRFNIMDRVD